MSMTKRLAEDAGLFESEEPDDAERERVERERALWEAIKLLRSHGFAVTDGRGREWTEDDVSTITNGEEF
jgi:hypothetical protein